MRHISIKDLPSMFTIGMGSKTLFRQAAIAATGQNFVEAFNLFRQSAEKGWPSAYLMLAECYRRGRGTLQNNALALSNYKIAAACGISEAMFQLALIYHEGLGVPVNHEQGDTWMHDAANHGHVAAIDHLRTVQQMVQKDFHPHESPSPSPSIPMG